MRDGGGANWGRSHTARKAGSHKTHFTDSWLKANEELMSPDSASKTPAGESSEPLVDWTLLAGDRSAWRHRVHRDTRMADEARGLLASEEKAYRTPRAQIPPAQTAKHICDTCGRKCRSGIGLYAHSRRYRGPTTGSDLLGAN